MILLKRMIVAIKQHLRQGCRIHTSWTAPLLHRGPDLLRLRGIGLSDQTPTAKAATASCNSVRQQIAKTEAYTEECVQLYDWLIVVGQAVH